MLNSEHLSQKIIEILSQPGAIGESKLSPELLQSIHSALQDQVQQTAHEREIHKRISADMLTGLHNIYREIAKISDQGHKGERPQSADEASAVFREASRQLDEIMTTTYNAADNIMNQVENIQNNQGVMCRNIKKLRTNNADQTTLDALSAALKENMDAIGEIVTALSFQDLTGQRIKKVVNALSSVHQMVVETYISTGLMLKKSEENPGKDFDTIKQESKTQAEATVKGSVVGSELKGPTTGSSQSDVDDLLAQLGL